MNQEQIEQIARDEWEKLGAFTDDQGKLKSEWEFFAKGIEVALSKYKFTEQDMKNAFMQCAFKDEEPFFNEWMTEYETQRKEGE